jgi:hypothetical protein
VFTARVVGAEQGSSWDVPSRTCNSLEEAWAYIAGVANACRWLLGARPKFQIDGSEYGDIDVDEVLHIERLSSPCRPSDAPGGGAA